MAVRLNTKTKKRKYEQTTLNDLDNAIEKEMNQRTNQRLIEKKNLESRAETLRLELEVVWGCRLGIRRRLQALYALGQVEAQIQKFRSGFSPPYLKIASDPLKLNHKDSLRLSQQKHIIFDSVFRPDTCIATFMTDKTCSVCKIPLSNLPSESVHVCTRCGSTSDYIHCDTDYIEGDIPDRSVIYNRTPLYRKYLSQFHEGVKNPPLTVLDILRMELSKNYCLAGAVIRPTPIIAILKRNKIQNWSWMVGRITRILNGEQVLSLSSRLIQKLVDRFDKINKLTTTQDGVKDQKKILNFEFLTKQFLLMENEHIISENYHLHKTRSVLCKADTRFRKLCDILQRDDDRNWTTRRLC
jgi:hypothetical protein